MDHGSQSRSSAGWGERGGAGADVIIPNPKLKLLDQVSEVNSKGKKILHQVVQKGVGQ